MMEEDKDSETFCVWTKQTGDAKRQICT